jgi:hypothetical protein
MTGQALVVTAASCRAAGLLGRAKEGAMSCFSVTIETRDGLCPASLHISTAYDERVCVWAGTTTIHTVHTQGAAVCRPQSNVFASKR